MSKLTTAILDVLSDGEWHAKREINDRILAITPVKKTNVDVALREMTYSNKIKRRLIDSSDKNYEYHMGSTIMGFGRSHNIVMLDSLLSKVRGALWS